jgi:hypothetical protein
MWASLGLSQGIVSYDALVQVEDAVLDTYDFVYDQAMKSPSSNWWQELAVIQDTVS